MRRASVITLLVFVALIVSSAIAAGFADGPK